MRINFIITSLLIISCNSNNDFTINGTIDADDGAKVYILQADQNNKVFVKDSTVIKNSKFKFKGEAATPEKSWFKIEGTDGYALSIIEAGKINAEIYKDSVIRSLITGTKSNNDLNKLRDETKSLVQNISKIAYDQQQAIFNNDLVLASKLQKDLSRKEQEIMLYQWDFIIDNEDSYISAFFLEEFMIENKVNKDSIIEVYNTFSNRIKVSNVGKNIADLLRQYEDPINIGEFAPDFTAPSVNGDNITLSTELQKNKVTLIDFWAAWCRPCRIENPNLVRLHKKYKDSGFDIIGVSLDRTREQWEQAIKDDNLTWTQVSNLNFWNDPVARRYRIRAIPQSYLLNQDGLVMGKNLRGEALEARIQALLKVD